MRTKADKCWRGHPLTEDNLYGRSTGTRECRACSLIRSKARFRYPGGMKQLFIEAINALRPFSTLVNSKGETLRPDNAADVWRAAEVIKQYDATAAISRDKPSGS